MKTEEKTDIIEPIQSFFSESWLIINSDKASEAAKRIQEFANSNSIVIRSFSFADFIETCAEGRLNNGIHVVAAVEDSEFHELLKLAAKEKFSLGFIPLSKKSTIAKWFKLPGKNDELIKLAFSNKPGYIDYISCNNHAVFGSATIGRTPFIKTKSYIQTTSAAISLLEDCLEFLSSLRGFFSTKPFSVSIKTGSDTAIKTAVTGLVLLENDRAGIASNLINSTVSGLDHKLSLLIISPRSIMDYLSFLFFSAFSKDLKTKKLPQCISYIKSDYLELIGENELECIIDGHSHSGRNFHFELDPKAISLNYGEGYSETCKESCDGKNICKIEQLPRNEEYLSRIQKHLPFFTCASEEDFKELFVTLRNNARVSADYLVMMSLSAIVASLGLFLNSAAVIIGAMLLAPLMGPIISFSMALLRRDVKLILESGRTIAGGASLALLISSAMALIIPIHRLTSEISGRISPSLLDLGVAIAAGTAGAYARARPDVSGSLPGVAIAVALVPPLCAAGIGIGWLDSQIISGALLLFATNLIGITLASSATFMILGYAPIVKARLGLGISLAMLIMVGIPLSVTFETFHKNWQIENTLISESLMINNKEMHLEDLQIVNFGKRILLRAFISSRHELAEADIILLKKHLQSRLACDITLEVTARRVY